MDSSITKRWVKASLLPSLIVLLLAEIIFFAFLRNSYYSAADEAILSRINSITNTLNASRSLSEGERNRLLYRISEEFPEKDRFELMLINPDGMISATSTGFMPGDLVHLDDVRRARNSYDGVYVNRYRTEFGEKVLTATCVIEPATKDVYALRLVTGLENVDREIRGFVLMSLILAGVVLAFILTSGMYFIRSIVTPLQSIEKGAEKISKGEFDTRIDNVYNDEIGRLCEAVNNMAEELGRTDEIKNEFISGVSHELRTPLTAIKGWAETIRGDPGRQTVQRGTRVILSETDRLYTMVQNLLDFSRLQQSDIKLSKERIDLMAEVGDAVIMFDPRCRRAGIELVRPDTEDVVPVFGDRDRLRQVMINLLDNSIKYTPAGGRIEIGLRQDKIRSLVTVWVLDNGSGIKKEDIDKVTQKFYKAKNSKPGSGIGLALVKEIIEAHGGTFKVESRYGRWTKMSFTLKTVRAGRRRNEG